MQFDFCHQILKESEISRVLNPPVRLFNLNKKTRFENFCAGQYFRPDPSVMGLSVSLWVALAQFSGKGFKGTFVGSKIDKGWGTRSYRGERLGVQIK